MRNVVIQMKRKRKTKQNEWWGDSVMMSGSKVTLKEPGSVPMTFDRDKVKVTIYTGKQEDWTGAPEIVGPK